MAGRNGKTKIRFVFGQKLEEKSISVGIFIRLQTTPSMYEEL